MALADQINDDLTAALKAGETKTVSTLRLLKNSLDAGTKDKGQDLSDDEVTKIIQKEIKQRRESADSYRQGDRQELAESEESEIKLLEKYLPEPLSVDELNKIIEQAINDVGASSMADMGKVMGAVNAKVAGRADGGQVAQLVKAKLGN